VRVEAWFATPRPFSLPFRSHEIGYIPLDISMVRSSIIVNRGRSEDPVKSAANEKELRIVGTRPIRPDGVEKVTGRANFGADRTVPGMLYGKIKRSPHAHARILGINADKALALPGVKAVVTASDFPEIRPEESFVGEGPMNFRDLSRNVMARDRPLYEGHAVAAVAALSPIIAAEAIELIEVEYEALPHVIDVEAAMAPDAPLLHDDLFTQGVDPKPEKPSNIAKQVAFSKGDTAAGFREANVIIERRYTTKPVHQAYIEPHACVVSAASDGQVQIWASSQGQFMIRAYCAKLAGIDIANIRVTPAEIGGGFGGKTLIYLEPVALALSRKTGRPVKIVMTREEVFRATGPTRAESSTSSSGPSVTEPSLPPRWRSNTRPEHSPARRCSQVACAALRCTTCRTCRSPATTSCRTGPRSRPTAHRERRSRPSGSKAASTSFPASCASIHSFCARRTPRQRAPRPCTARPGPISAISTR
jgi:hypothetical protein